MDKTARASLDAYYRDGERWGGERLALLLASRRIARVVAGAAVAVAVFEGVALLSLLPIDSVQPYAMLVERHTGRVQALSATDERAASSDAALVQMLLVRYVIARESFDIDDVQNAYARVVLWSAQGARAEYLLAMQNGNPASPIALYPRDTTIETRIASVSPLDERSALVRFDTVRRDANGAASVPTAWTATIRYRFSTAPLSAADRFDDPLGFEVVAYRRSIDRSVPTAPPPAAMRVDVDAILSPGGVTRPGVPRTGGRVAAVPGATPTIARPTPPTEPPRRTPPPGIEITL